MKTKQSEFLTYAEFITVDHRLINGRVHKQPALFPKEPRTEKELTINYITLIGFGVTHV